MAVRETTFGKRAETPNIYLQLIVAHLDFKPANTCGGENYKRGSCLDFDLNEALTVLTQLTQSSPYHTQQKLIMRYTNPVDLIFDDEPRVKKEYMDALALSVGCDEQIFFMS